VQNPIRITHFGYHIKGPVDNPWFKDQWDCFDAHKDIVVAPYDSYNLPRPGHEWPPLRELLRGKTQLFMYSGYVENVSTVGRWRGLRWACGGCVGLAGAVLGWRGLCWAGGGWQGLSTAPGPPGAAGLEPSQALLQLPHAPGAEQAVCQPQRPGHHLRGPPAAQVPRRRQVRPGPSCCCCFLAAAARPCSGGGRRAACSLHLCR
jgi:hypothetical protein